MFIAPFSFYTVPMKIGSICLGRVAGRRIAFAASPGIRVAICLAAFLAMPFSAGVSHGQPGQFPTQSGVKDPSAIPPLGRGTVDKDDPLAVTFTPQQLKQLNVQRQKQMADDTVKLLALANELKSELDKGGKDASSIVQVRKAEKIEKLAHEVGQKMKTPITN
jgi:hypothetical protein